MKRLYAGKYFVAHKDVVMLLDSTKTGTGNLNSSSPYITSVIHFPADLALVKGEDIRKNLKAVK